MVKKSSSTKKYTLKKKPSSLSRGSPWYIFLYFLSEHFYTQICISFLSTCSMWYTLSWTLFFPLNNVSQSSFSISTEQSPLSLQIWQGLLLHGYTAGYLSRLLLYGHLGYFLLLKRKYCSGRVYIDLPVHVAFISATIQKMVQRSSCPCFSCSSFQVKFSQVGISGDSGSLCCGGRTICGPKDTKEYGY